MFKQAFWLVFVFFLICGESLAGYSVYTIEKKFEAVFPSNPKFVGELGEGKEKHRSYNAADESNLIIYTATYQVGKTRFKKSDVPVALKNYVKGLALSVDGKVVDYSYKIVNGHESAVYSMKYQLQGVSLRKYGIVSYKDGHFYLWSVQDLPSMSKQSAKVIFNKYLTNFSVK